MSEPAALVLGGTGMLAGCVARLLAQGWHVVLPSRRKPSYPDNGPGRAARAALRPPGHTKWVAADWSHPDQLADRAREALGKPASLLVARVHASYRESVLHAVAPLLAPRAPVVEVYDSSEINPVCGLADPLLEGHPTQQVMLGFVRHRGVARWLTQEEISAGVLEAVRRALWGRPSSMHHIGELDTWPVRH